jgi:hypothetical protein
VGDIKGLLKHIVDSRKTSVKIQCANNKSEPSTFKVFDEAIDYNFIRFGNKFYIPAISMDIDTHQNIDEVIDICTRVNIPKPNFIVKTSKGIHVHWVLKYPIVTQNLKQTGLYNKIVDRLLAIFDSDLHAIPRYSGRMFRNPLKHDTTFYTDTLYSLTDFVKLLPRREVGSKNTYTRTKKLRYKVPKFENIEVGGRNKALFDYGRYVAYKHGNCEGIDKIVLSALQFANNKLPHPLRATELMSISASITRFMRSSWDSKTSNKRTIEFNRNLAKRQAELKQNELIRKFVSYGLLTLRDLKRISARHGGRLFGVSKNTFAKHREKLIKIIKTLHVLSLNLVKYVKEIVVRPISCIEDDYSEAVPATVKNNSPPI